LTGEKEYVTLQEASAQLGIKRASLYYYLKRMEIEPQHFPLNRHAYITQVDFQRIKDVKESPWKAEDTSHVAYNLTVFFAAVGEIAAFVRDTQPRVKAGKENHHERATER
jgi:hypothetical protein